MLEYRAIMDFYGDRTTARSGVPLMNHIDEGLVLLEHLGASELARRAYCLHPIVQNNEPIDVSWSPAYGLACEYGLKANSFLCRPENDGIETAEQLSILVGFMTRDCAHMLMADKVQNRQDFRAYHEGTHPRSAELARYFDLWIDFLERRLEKPDGDD